jgi:SOS-response transcriptional repressor LexA
VWQVGTDKKLRMKKKKIQGPAIHRIGSASLSTLSNKYEVLKFKLEDTGTGAMKAFGNSMTPILSSGSLLTFKKQESYEVGDIVFSKVHGRYIDAHKIIKKDAGRGYLIANNHGHENGWTRQVFGKVVKAEYNGQIKEFK